MRLCSVQSVGSASLAGPSLLSSAVSVDPRMRGSSPPALPYRETPGGSNPKFVVPGEGMNGWWKTSLEGYPGKVHPVKKGPNYNDGTSSCK